MKGLNGLLSGMMESIEAKSWEEKNEAGWSAVLTYEHGGAYYSFKLEKVEQSEKHPHGITEERLKEIAAALPKLRPLADGIGRRFILAAHKIETKSQRKL